MKMKISSFIITILLVITATTGCNGKNKDEKVGITQEDEDKVIELTSKYYPTIWDEKRCIAYLCRECKIIIIDI